MNPFPLLAYQKIYYDFYRNSQWESSNPSCYNLDYITGSADCQIPVQDISVHGSNMFDLRYANFNKDYYFGLMPRSQYGDEAVIPLAGNISTQVFDTYDGYQTPVKFNFGSISDAQPGETSITSLSFLSELNDADEVVSKSLNGRYGNTGENASSSALNLDLTQFSSDLKTALKNAYSDLSILVLRQYEMLQRYREVQQSADTDYKDQIEKLFGVSLSWKDSNKVRWLGGTSRSIDISEVINQSLSSPDDEADIRGKGVGFGEDDTITFDSQGEYGLLVCVYHNAPIMDYSLDVPLKLNQKYRFSDYAQPAFDRIGMQAIPFLELFNDTNTLSSFRVNDYWTADRLKSAILGYGPRYLDYKTQIDRVVGSFRVDMKQWVTPIDSEFWNSYIFINDIGDARFDESLIFNYSSFKINPAILNPIFVTAADSDVSSDQFLCNAAFEISDVKNLDYDGMPY